MNISDWPDYKLMQLPDWMYGPKWPISLYLFVDVAADVFAISNMALPDKCVIWQGFIVTQSVSATNCAVELRLADQLPANLAQFNEGEPIFRDLRGFGNTQSTFGLGNRSPGLFFDCKVLIKAQGRRLTVRGKTSIATSVPVQCGIVISSVPMEIPEWYRSGPPSSR